MESLSVVLGSTLLATLVSAWVSKTISERRIYAENITKERAKWRDRIRLIASRYPSANAKEQGQYEIEFISRLNPYDPEDLKLVESLRESGEKNSKELAIRVALLLKHDWERAKNEAKPLTGRCAYPTKRLTYKEYMLRLEIYKKGKIDEFVHSIKRLTRDGPG